MSRTQARSRAGAWLVLGAAVVALVWVGCEEPVAEVGLHQATENEDLAQVRALLAKGADPDAVDGQGKTPLHLAADLGLWPILEELLDAGAAVGPRDAEGQTPLHLAPRGDHGVRPTLLLLGHGANPRAADNQGLTPLHGDLSGRKMRILIGRGADVQAQDHTGRTALHVAAGFGRGGAMIVLVEAGADVNATDEAGRTPLHYSVVHPSSVLASVLIEGGIDLDHQDGSGATALHVAAGGGMRRIIRQLVDAGADRSVLDSEGRTPLQVAIEAKHEINTKTLRAYESRSRRGRRKATEREPRAEKAPESPPTTS